MATLCDLSRINALFNPCRNEFKQTPAFRVFPGHELGEFVFGSPKQTIPQLPVSKPSQIPHEVLEALARESPSFFRQRPRAHPDRLL